MPIFYALLLIVLSTGSITACSNSKEPQLINHKSQDVPESKSAVFTGTIVYKNVEGGFFALLTEDNQRFTLHKLPAAYQLDGLVVELSGEVNKDKITISQFGEVLEVDSVTIIDDSQARPPAASPRKLKTL